MLTGAYRPGGSMLHHAPAGVKLLGLLLLTSLLVAVRSPPAVVAGLVLVSALHVAAGLGATAWLAEVWPLRFVLVLLVAFQVWTAGWAAAVTVTGTLVVTVAAAGLVTMTTRTADLLDVVVGVTRPLQHLGVDAERVALVLTMAIRTVPVLVERAAQIRDARRARGLERSTHALVVPLVLQTVRHADRLGEALMARGVDD